MTASASAANRSFVFLLSMILASSLVMIARPAIADSIEGERSYVAGRKDEAIRLLRRSAWQENDFFAQVKLGDIYSAKNASDKGYEDRVEAFVWYYLAARNPNMLEHVHVEDAAAEAVEYIATAEGEASKIYATLLQDERIDVRNRIVYIQSCLGGAGQLRVGMYYDPNISYRHQSGIAAPTSSGGFGLFPIIRPFQNKYLPMSGGLTITPGYVPPRNQGPTRSWPSTSSGPSGPSSSAGPSGSGGPVVGGPPPLNPASGAPAIQGSVAKPLGRWASDICRESTWWGWIFGDPSRCYANDQETSSAAVFAPSSVEAMMHYYLAKFGDHQLADKYIESLRRSGEGPELEQIAKGKAKRWLAPFEYYASESRERGETLSGLVHSDECPVNSERARALAVGDRTISPEIRMDMLKFLNFNRGDGLPASVAVKKFQDFMGDEPVGVLTAMQTVRLFQIAATRGYVRGQRCLGIMYLKGIGVVKNAVRAEKWLLTASNQGDGEAMYALSELYSLGADGVEKLEDKANRYRQGAAIAGFTPVKAEFLRLLETAPVRPAEGAKPIETGAESGATTDEQSVREKPRKRTVPRRRVRKSQRDPDDGPFGE